MRSRTRRISTDRVPIVCHMMPSGSGEEAPNSCRASAVADSPVIAPGESATAEARQLLGASSPDPDGIIWHTIGTRSVLIRLVLLRMAEPAHYPQSITSLLAAIALYDHDTTTHG